VNAWNHTTHANDAAPAQTSCVLSHTLSRPLESFANEASSPLCPLPSYRPLLQKPRPTVPLAPHLQAQVLRLVLEEIHLFALSLQHSGMLVLDPKPQHPRRHAQFCISPSSFRWLFGLLFMIENIAPSLLQGNYNTSLNSAQLS